MKTRPKFAVTAITALITVIGLATFMGHHRPHHGKQCHEMHQHCDKSQQAKPAPQEKVF